MLSLIVFSFIVVSLAAVGSTAPSTCKAQFGAGVFNVLLSEDNSYGWQYWPGVGQVSPSVQLTKLDNLTAPDTTWYLWPNNGSSPDWTISTVQFDRFETCVLAPNATLPAPLTDGPCVDPSTGYGADTAVFSVDCETCFAGAVGGTGCVLTMPYIGTVCPTTPPKSSTNGLITLTKCGYSENQKWDIVLAA